GASTARLTARLESTTWPASQIQYTTSLGDRARGWLSWSRISMRRATNRVSTTEARPRPRSSGLDCPDSNSHRATQTTNRLATWRGEITATPPGGPCRGDDPGDC